MHICMPNILFLNVMKLIIADDLMFILRIDFIGWHLEIYLFQFMMTLHEASILWFEEMFWFIWYLLFNYVS